MVLVSVSRLLHKRPLEFAMFYSVFKVRIQRGVEVFTSALGALYFYTTQRLQECQGVRKSFFTRSQARPGNAGVEALPRTSGGSGSASHFRRLWLCLALPEAEPPGVRYQAGAW